MNKESKKNKARICIYCPYCYPMFNSQFKGHFGGWEVRVSLIAKELARRGNFDVTMIVADHGQPQVEDRGGVRLVSWVGKEFWQPPAYDTLNDNKIDSSVTELSPHLEHKKSFSSILSGHKQFFYAIKSWLFKHIDKKTLVIAIYSAKSFFEIMANLYWGIREALKLSLRSINITIKELIALIRQALHMRGNVWGVIDQNTSFIIWRKDIILLEQVDAAIYIVPGNHSMSAITAFFCEKREKKYVFLAGSEMDYYPEFKTQPDRHDIYGEPYYLKAYAIEHADLHIAQTQRQADMLQAGFGRSAQIIHNPIDLSSALPRIENPDKILWVGTSDERVKRPSLVFELARLLPDFSFIIIMKCLTKDDVLANAKVAELLPNVELKFDVPFVEIEKYFADAKLFINTSAFEGFPNTFLQAAKYGVPIISIDVDPEGMLSQHACGIACGGDFKRLAESVQVVMTDARVYTKMSTAARAYVSTYHDKDIIIGQYEKAFREVLLSIH